MAFCIYSKASPRTQISQPPQPFCPTRSPEISLPATGRYLEARETNLKRERICLCSAGVKDWICFEVGLVLCVKALYRCKWRWWPFTLWTFWIVGNWRWLLRYCWLALGRRTFSKLLGCIFFLVFVETFGGLGLILHLLLFVLRYFHFLALSFTTFHSIVLKLCVIHTLWS